MLCLLRCFTAIDVVQDFPCFSVKDAIKLQDWLKDSVGKTFRYAYNRWLKKSGCIMCWEVQQEGDDHFRNSIDSLERQTPNTMDTEGRWWVKVWHSLWGEVRVSLRSVVGWTENHPGINQVKKTVKDWWFREASTKASGLCPQWCWVFFRHTWN